VLPARAGQVVRRPRGRLLTRSGAVHTFVRVATPDFRAALPNQTHGWWNLAGLEDEVIAVG
jgi:hypothetical protein